MNFPVLLSGEKCATFTTSRPSMASPLAWRPWRPCGDGAEHRQHLLALRLGAEPREMGGIPRGFQAGFTGILWSFLDF